MLILSFSSLVDTLRSCLGFTKRSTNCVVWSPLTKTAFSTKTGLSQICPAPFKRWWVITCALSMCPKCENDQGQSAPSDIYTLHNRRYHKWGTCSPPPPTSIQIDRGLVCHFENGRPVHHFKMADRSTILKWQTGPPPIV